MMNTWVRRFSFTAAYALFVGAIMAPSASAAILFSYDGTTGQLPTDQGWQAYEVDVDGPLTAANTAGITTSGPRPDANTSHNRMSAFALMQMIKMSRRL